MQYCVLEGCWAASEWMVVPEGEVKSQQKDHIRSSVALKGSFKECEKYVEKMELMLSVRLVLNGHNYVKLTLQQISQVMYCLEGHL